MQRWSRLTSSLRLREKMRVEEDAKSLLDAGEVRLELQSCRLNKNGVMKLAALQPGNAGAAVGDSHILLKTSIPCEYFCFLTYRASREKRT